MSRAPIFRHGAAGSDDNGRVRPLAFAAVMLAVFVTTVIVLAVQAGTGAAMLTTLFAIVVAGTVCGLFGTAMAVKETHADRHAMAAHVVPARATTGRVVGAPAAVGRDIVADEVTSTQ
jgi:uncharacterized membrane protein YdcZ (DUF606 family)